MTETFHFVFGPKSVPTFRSQHSWCCFQSPKSGQSLSGMQHSTPLAWPDLAMFHCSCISARFPFANIYHCSYASAPVSICQCLSWLCFCTLFMRQKSFVSMHQVTKPGLSIDSDGTSVFRWFSNHMALDGSLSSDRSAIIWGLRDTQD